MISSRQSQLLDFIVREYVKNAEPIGSALICEKSDFNLSPATIRNEMQILEEEGYLAQPHTSAGRIPTDKAYRYFVNNLLESGRYDVDLRSKKKINQALGQSNQNPKELNKTAAQILQELSENLVIANIEKSDDFYKIGLSSLMEFPEFREFERTFQLMNFFDRFDEMFDRMEREFFGVGGRNNNFNIFIGRENNQKNIKDETVMSVKYRLPNGQAGSLTIIGPTRMDYRKNIGLITYTSELLNKIAEEN
jgi:transcriptional regulator of heat shock response